MAMYAWLKVFQTERLLACPYLRARVAFGSRKVGAGMRVVYNGSVHASLEGVVHDLNGIVVASMMSTHAPRHRCCLVAARRCHMMIPLVAPEAPASTPRRILSDR